MAARFNVRFLLILIIVLGTLVGITGALALFVFKKDAAHFIAEGDALRAEGALNQARSQYKRAMGEEPQNRVALENVEAMLGEYRPESRQEAQDALTEVLSVRKHRATHFPDESQGHLALLRELHEASILMNGLRALWDREGSSATTDFMAASQMSSDPGFSYAKLYRGMWLTYPIVDVAGTRDAREQREGLELIQASVAENPNRDMDHAVLLRVLANRAGRDATSPEELQAAIADALAKVPDGIQTRYEIVRVRATEAAEAGTAFTSAQASSAAGTLGDDLATYEIRSTEASAERAAQVRALHQLFERYLAEKSDDPDFVRVVAEVAPLLARIGAFERDLSPAPSLELLIAKPEWQDDARIIATYANVRALLAKGNATMDDLKAAVEAGEQISSLANQPAGVRALLQRPLILEGRFIQLDAEFARWDRLEGMEQIDAIADVQAARDAVLAAAAEEGMGGDSRNHRLVRARALTEFAAGNRDRAAGTLTQLLTDSVDRFDPTDRAQLRFLLAICLEEDGALGPAAQTLRAAVAEQPQAHPLQYRLGRVLTRLGELDEARQSLRMLRQFGAPAAVVNDLQNRIEFASGGAISDPVIQALSASDELTSRGDVDGAIEMLEAARVQFPTDIRLLVALGNTAMGDSRRDLAVASFEEASRLDPDNTVIRAALLRLTTDDPVERVVETLRAAVSDPMNRAVRIVVAMDRQVAARERELERVVDPERRSEIEGEIARFNAAIAEWTGQANTLLAEAPEPPFAAMTLWANRRLERALEAQEWATGETIVEEIREADLDRADGAMAEGLLNLYRASTLTGDERNRTFVRAEELLEAATGRLPFSWRAWDALGDARRLQGDIEGATLAYGRAHENDPTDRALAYRYIDALERIGNRARATGVARDAASRMPDDRFMRSLWLTLERRAGNSATVLLERRASYRTNPADKENAMRYALALVGTRPQVELLVDDDGSPKVSGVRWSQMPEGRRQAMLDEERRQWVVEAESITNDLRPDETEGMPGLTWGLLRAELDRAQGDLDAGVAALTAAYEAQTNIELQMSGLAIIAAYLNEARRPSDAVALLRSARETVPAERADPWWLEATLLTSLGQSEAAIPVLEATLARVQATPSIVATADLDNLGVQQEILAPERVERQLVQALMSNGQIDRAADRWAAFFGDSRDVTDRLLGSAIDVRRLDAAYAAGDAATATDIASALDVRLRELTSAVPADQRGWALRIEMLLRDAARTGDDEYFVRADELLQEARRTAPGAGPLDRVTRRVLVGLADDGGLILELERQLDANPGDDGVRRALADAMTSADRVDDAIDVINAGISFHGRRRESLGWRNRLGELFEQQGDFDRAARAFNDGWELSGKTEPAFLVGMTRTMLQLSPPEYNRIIGALRDRDAEMNVRPSLRTIYARALSGAGRASDSLREYGTAYNRIREMIAAGVTPERGIARWVGSLQDAAGPDGMGDAEAFTRQIAGDRLGPWELAALSSGWYARGGSGLDNAIARIREAISVTPASDTGTTANLNLQLASYMLESGRPDAALAAFEAGLEATPENPTLLNNVAFLRATELDDPSGALPLAERAVALRPRDWAMLDTVGKICAQLGRWEEAEDYLTRSIDVSPQGRNVFHMAEVMAGMERWDDAMRRLERAAELTDPADAGLIGEIDALTDTVRRRQSGG
ncbi:MAG: tetratricopeptide repeat protein [Phycisphaerales bacterium]